MQQGYAKKAAKPSNVISLSFLVLGFRTVIVYESFGIVSKNVWILANWSEFRLSRKYVYYEGMK